MKILALDNALRITGWSIFEDSKLVSYGKFTIAANDDLSKRLGEYWKQLDTLYEANQFDYLYFEDCQQQANAQTYHKLSMVKATILLWCYFHEMPYTVLSPSEWRKILRGEHGRNFGRTRVENKKVAKALVADLYKIEATEDECDSICIGIAGMLEQKKHTSAF